MSWIILFGNSAIKDMKALDRQTRRRIIEKIENDLAQNPIGKSATLEGSLKIYRKYRVGDWRVIFRLDMKKQKIHIRRISHRSRAYRKIE